MVLQSAYAFSDVASPTVEVSKETLGSILSQIETDLYNSEIYRRAMAGLHTMLGESVGTAHIMVKAVGREAIRLAFQQLAKQYKVVPVASPSTSSIQNPKEEQPITSASVVHEETVSPDPVTSEPIETFIDSDDLEDLLKPFGLTSTLPDIAKTLKKPNQEELAAEKALQVREECLQQIGQEIMQARLLRSISQEQLHRQTLVPLYHIEALEAGRIDKLPEDVYVRSFIRLLGNAVGLDGAAMAANLPDVDLVKSVVPSWYKVKSASGLSLTPVHLYVGYAALVAGAVGGLTWMSQQSTSGISVKDNTHFSFQTPKFQAANQAETVSKPGVKVGKRGISIGADIAPPEQSF